VRILAVDDDPMRRKILTALEEFGLDVEVVDSIRDAESVVDAGFSPTVALCDVNGVDGSRLIDEFLASAALGDIDTVVLSDLSHTVRPHPSLIGYLPAPFFRLSLPSIADVLQRLDREVSADRLRLCLAWQLYRLSDLRRSLESAWLATLRLREEAATLEQRAAIESLEAALEDIVSVCAELEKQ